MTARAAARGIVTGAAAVAAATGAGLVVDRAPPGIDAGVEAALRAAGRPTALRGAAIDVTALGSVVVLTLVVLAVAALLVRYRRRAAALALALSCASVAAASEAVKTVVARPRPAILAHLVDAHGTSFPSGHAAGSAMVWLTLAALAGRLLPTARAALLAMAALVALLVGASRVYLGVHWPSDVAAGWAFGAAWAGGCWAVAARYYPR